MAYERQKSRQALLQRELGNRGEILPRIEHGTHETPAQGWWAILPSGERVFLGDHSGVSYAAIARGEAWRLVPVELEEP